jgi:hypothetical protein
VLSVISAGLVRRFSKEKLTLKESFFVSLLACGASMIPLIAYFAFRRQWGLPLAADSIATFAWMFLTGWIISRRAQAYGVVKTGWFGVGAKTMFSLLIISWVVTLVGVVLNMMK